MSNSAAFFVGQSSSLARSVTAELVEEFARLSGDINPAHLDETYAATTRFGKRIAHGMLAASFISAAIGTQFPGPGTIYMGQSLKFTKPVYLGDTLTVVLTVTKYRADKAILTMDTTVRNQRGEGVVSGEAVCLVSDILAAAHPRLEGAGAAAS